MKSIFKAASKNSLNSLESDDKLLAFLMLLGLLGLFFLPRLVRREANKHFYDSRHDSLTVKIRLHLGLHLFCQRSSYQRFGVLG